MWIITLIALSSIIFIGSMFFIECKIVADLPEQNAFKKWWRRNIIAPDPEG